MGSFLLSMKHYLKNYMRTLRIREGFAQSDIAYLIESESRSQISRYEQWEREPTLSASLMYKIIFGKNDLELYPALVEELEERIRRRAPMRYEELQGNSSWQIKRRLDAFEALFERIEKPNQY